jgi:hypothetical protein
MLWAGNWRQGCLSKAPSGRGGAYQCKRFKFPSEKGLINASSLRKARGIPMQPLWIPLRKRRAYQCNPPQEEEGLINSPREQVLQIPKPSPQPTPHQPLRVWVMGRRDGDWIRELGSRLHLTLRLCLKTHTNKPTKDKFNNWSSHLGHIPSTLGIFFQETKAVAAHLGRTKLTSAVNSTHLRCLVSVPAHFGELLLIGLMILNPGY